MSLLTTEQKAAIAAGAAIRQVFKLYGPTTDGGSPTVANLLHDDATSTLRVTNAGRRTVEAYNVSMAEPGRLGIASYTIECQNADGMMSPYATSTVWSFDIGGGYVRFADPKECLLKHQVYVLVANAWSEITGVAYTGKVAEVRYNVAAGTCEVTSETYVANLLVREWTRDDGYQGDTGLDANLTGQIT